MEGTKARRALWPEGHRCKTFQNREGGKAMKLSKRYLVMSINFKKNWREVSLRVVNPLKQFMNKMLINHILFIGPIENLKHFVKRRQVKTIKFNLISMKKTTIHRKYKSRFKRPFCDFILANSFENNFQESFHSPYLSVPSLSDTIYGHY